MKGWARIGIVGVPLGCVLWLSACASQSGQQPVTATPATATTTPDGALVTPAPSQKGVIVPGDPASGTAGVGSGSGSVDTTTGTNSTRVKPGDSGDGK